ncbi:MAG TPA: hypothetical protein VNT28_04895 [Candidatus Limnocylindrales bacterium]|jgi:hypothetical protein|nr:hypothetical protein [Candidatus Limnocylindrales bacterium]
MSEALISDYLGRLDAAAWPLPPSRRSELTAEVREHIETALTEAGSRDEVTVRNVLDRLGRPEDIVAAEMEGEVPVRPATAGRGAAAAASGWLAQANARGWGLIEIAAVSILAGGWLLLWWVGPIIGAVLVWFSERWTGREKRVASAIVFGPLIAGLVLTVIVLAGGVGLGFGGFTGMGGVEFPRPGGFGVSFALTAVAALLVALLPIVAGVGAAIYLGLALQRRR